MCSIVTRDLLPRRTLGVMETHPNGSIPRLVGAAATNPGGKAILAIFFCDYFAKSLELVAFFLVG